MVWYSGGYKSIPSRLVHLKSATSMVEYSKTMLPALEAILVQGVLLRYQAFSPSYFTTLSLFDVIRLNRKEFFQILATNRCTLHILELGQDFVLLNMFMFERPLTLPYLPILSVSVLDARSWCRLLGRWRYHGPRICR
ncbi:hypothetical protein E1B28_006587 [Marasmius oreades]|uniref:Uncharacterized protein n=1 Tax=Marasmius oreades TaxID=181124 RepID=A0A9P7UWF7_9AGAR|nr:uncharacterized protein E1B28_006587 [Marasmius oreades]KAG7095900.1 hypothetical protein E1B28_006587 [Marasmius oreades]